MQYWFLFAAFVCGYLLRAVVEALYEITYSDYKAATQEEVLKMLVELGAKHRREMEKEEDTHG